jgi:GNAT superfamily N-acetyltransferase
VSDVKAHVTVRAAALEDAPFIFSSWLKSYRQSEAVKGLSDDIYFDGQRSVINRILLRSACLVAVDPDDASHLYGFICFEEHYPNPVLHYVYVKQAYRKLGVASLLMGEMFNLPIIYSHEGTFKSKLAPGSYFNPYKA